MNHPHPQHRTDPFEEELRTAMRPVEPPAGFAAAVLARIAAEPDKPRLLAFPPSRFGPARLAFRKSWTAGLLAASLLAGTTGTLAYHAHQRREADRQFVLAMRVTNHALAETRQQLNRAGFRLND